MEPNVFTMKVFDNTVFTAGAGLIKETPALDMRQIAPNWAFSVQHKFTGTGTLKLECLVSSEKDGDFFEACDDIEGTAAVDTIVLKAFTPVFAPFMKFRATASAITLTGLKVWLNSR